ncbi:MAG: NAD-dependent protein deacylase, partial [Negativicutes bacterium]|nr:NAD-dependent protein deacylase [Negativicutes bacterium]
LYGESLDSGVMRRASRYLSQADMLIIGGTSLVVYPAARLGDLYRGDKLVVINRDATDRDRRARLLIRDRICSVLSQIRVGVHPDLQKN